MYGRSNSNREIANSLRVFPSLARVARSGGDPIGVLFAKIGMPDD